MTRPQIEAFQAWMVDTRSASTALNKHKALQQFFKWLTVDEEEIDQSPMLRARQPKIPKRLIPIVRDEDTKKILDTCKGKDFVQLRDEMIIRLLYNTGARLSEVANLAVGTSIWPWTRSACTARVRKTGGWPSGRRPPVH